MPEKAENSLMNPNELKNSKNVRHCRFSSCWFCFLPTMLIEPQNEALHTTAASYAEAVRGARLAVRNRENFLDQSHRLQHLKICSRKQTLCCRQKQICQR